MITSVPEPTDVIPTMNPIDRPDCQGRRLLDEQLLVDAGGGAAAVIEIHLRQQRGDRDQQHRAERDAHDGLHLGSAADRLQEDDPEEGRGDRSEREPAGEVPADRPASRMNGGADRAS